MEVHDAHRCLRGKDIWLNGSIALHAKSVHASSLFEILLSPPTQPFNQTLPSLPPHITEPRRSLCLFCLWPFVQGSHPLLEKQAQHEPESQVSEPHSLSLHRWVVHTGDLTYSLNLSFPTWPMGMAKTTCWAVMRTGQDKITSKWFLDCERPFKC